MLQTQGVRITLETGASHAVDSSDVAFRLAAVGAFRQAYARAAPVVLEPQMQVEVRAPVEYQGSLMGDLNRRRGMIQDAVGEAEDTVITAQARALLTFACCAWLCMLITSRLHNERVGACHIVLPSRVLAQCRRCGHTKVCRIHAIARDALPAAHCLAVPVSTRSPSQRVQVPLSEMFGYSSSLRSQTAGKGEYSMEFLKHAAVPADAQAELMGRFKGGARR